MSSGLESTEWVENKPGRGFRLPNVGELWHYRELAWFLALRDVKVRYKQALLGATWAVFQPLAGVVVFTVVFQRFANVPSEGIPYPLFALVGLVVWTYASGSVTRATQSLVNNSPLVTKVYFPRLLAPMASVLPGLVDLLISFLIVLVLMLLYGIGPTWAIVTLPLWLLAAIAVALGIGLLLGTLNVRYRDVNHVITLLVQLWLFVTPVAYPSTLVPEAWRGLYYLNPMAGIVEGFRWAFVGTPWPGSGVYVSLGATIVFVVAGVAYFQRSERQFADVI
jgi:lipopolysaccharide transport system permease protein